MATKISRARRQATRTDSGPTEPLPEVGTELYSADSVALPASQIRGVLSLDDDIQQEIERIVAHAAGVGIPRETVYAAFGKFASQAIRSIGCAHVWDGYLGAHVNAVRNK